MPSTSRIGVSRYQGVEMIGNRPVSPGLDPLTALALDRIREDWAPVGYDVGIADGKPAAVWVFGDNPLLLTADSPPGLDSAIRADYARRTR